LDLLVLLPSRKALIHGERASSFFLVETPAINEADILMDDLR
jgi:hypothetical protein